MDFAEILSSWITTALKGRDLNPVKGLAFNLMEPGSGGFGVELIGSPTFSEDDPDWPCREIFVAYPRSITIPPEVHGGSWQSCLEAMTITLSEVLQSDSETSSLLKLADGIGVGFVDGDLLVIHPTP